MAGNAPRWLAPSGAPWLRLAPAKEEDLHNFGGEQLGSSQIFLGFVFSKSRQLSLPGRLPPRFTSVYTSKQSTKQSTVYTVYRSLPCRRWTRHPSVENLSDARCLRVDVVGRLCLAFLEPHFLLVGSPSLQSSFLFLLLAAACTDQNTEGIMR